MSTKPHNTRWHHACGKVILFGEHAVVYGVEAIAGAIPNAMRARVVSAKNQGVSLSIPKWQIQLEYGHPQPGRELLDNMLGFLIKELSLQEHAFHLELQPGIPHASGLGASAAVAVAAIRALAEYRGTPLEDTRVNELAYGCEQIAHGSPSGIDNTLATFGGLLRYQKTPQGPRHRAVSCPEPIPLIIAQSGKKGFTAAAVARVAQARDATPALYERIFNEIAELSAQALPVINQSDFATLAELLNRNQDLLRQMGVSCVEIEKVIDIATKSGALGAKLTGSGDGGSVVIYAGDRIPEVIAALHNAGFEAFTAHLGKL